MKNLLPEVWSATCSTTDPFILFLYFLSSLMKVFVTVSKKKEKKRKKKKKSAQQRHVGIENFKGVEIPAKQRADSV